MFTGKEKAAVAGVITFILGLANVIIPYVTDSSILHWITIGLAIISFVGTTVGVYQTTNSAVGTHTATATSPAVATTTTTTPDVDPAAPTTTTPTPDI